MFGHESGISPDVSGRPVAFRASRKKSVGVAMTSRVGDARLLQDLRKLQRVAGQVAQMGHLRVHAEHVARIALADGHVPGVYLPIRQTLENAHPLGRDLDAPFLDQSLQVSHLLRAWVRIHIIGDEDIVFEQEAELGRAVGQLDGLGNDLVAARETFLAGAAPIEVQM